MEAELYGILFFPNETHNFLQVFNLSSSTEVPLLIGCKRQAKEPYLETCSTWERVKWGFLVSLETQLCQVMFSGNCLLGGCFAENRRVFFWKLSGEGGCDILVERTFQRTHDISKECTYNPTDNG